MNKKNKLHIKNSALTIALLLSAFALGELLQSVFDMSEHITTLFTFAVFLISLLTDGYIYGLISTVLSVLVINFAFTDPLFGFDFSVPEKIFSALVMLIIALLTGALTTKLKKWRKFHSEGERERMRANLLRAVSHDLRTPLTTIYGASSSISENYDKLNDTQKKQMITGIKEDSQWLIRLVENLLSVTKIDGENVKLIKNPTVLEELIDSVMLKFNKRYPETKVEIDIPDDLVLIPMDPILIEQVILNILENAVLHAKGFTKIVLRVFIIEHKTIFEISDDGCGIDRERLPNIFAGYFDGNPKSDSKRRNAGIGLSVCATIIKAHGGSITAENSKLGGAIFRFSLSAKEENANEQQV